jgi:hypothetical protein
MPVRRVSEKKPSNLRSSSKERGKTAHEVQSPKKQASKFSQEQAVKGSNGAKTIRFRKEN